MTSSVRPRCRLRNSGAEYLSAHALYSGYAAVQSDGVVEPLYDLAPGASLSLSADIHPNVLNNSYDRVYLWARSVGTGA